MPTDSTTSPRDSDARNAIATHWDLKETLAMLSLDNVPANKESPDNVVTNAPHTTSDSVPMDVSHVTVSTSDRKANNVMSTLDNACVRRMLRDVDATSALRIATESPKDACHVMTVILSFRAVSMSSERKLRASITLFKRLSRIQHQSMTLNSMRRLRRLLKQPLKSGKLSSKRQVS